MVTYYNATTQKLPFHLHNFNLINPDSWQIISSGYNDNSNIASPNPKVALNFGQQEGSIVWAAESTGGNGIAMFDAPYSTYTGIFGNRLTDNSELFRIYPNPCNSVMTLEFDLSNPETVTITLYNLIGKQVGIIADQFYHDGRYLLKYDGTSLPTGSYLLSFKTPHATRTCKLLIIR